jgi:hypothetical protein
VNGHSGRIGLDSECVLRAKELEAYEAVGLEEYGEIIRLILAEASLLSEKYRYVRRHDVPHVRELTGLIDLLWQEIEMHSTPVYEVDPLQQVGTY